MTYMGHVENGTIVLDEPVALPDGAVVKVEVAVDAAGTAASSSKDILDLVSTLPVGTRTKEDIDRQMQEERGADVFLTGDGALRQCREANVVILD